MNLGVWLAMGRDATYVVRAAGAAASASTSTDRRRSTVRSSTPWSAPPRSSRRSVSAIPRSPPRTDLIRSSIPFVAAAQSPNEYGFAMGLETMNSLVPISGAAASLSFASAPGAFNVLAGDLHSSLRTNLVENAYDLGPAVVSRLDSAACVARAAGQVVSYAAGQPTANDDGCYGDRRAAWIQAFDSWSSNGGSDGVSGLLDSSGGLVGGVDAPAPGGWRVGGLIGYVHSTFPPTARPPTDRPTTCPWAPMRATSGANRSQTPRSLYLEHGFDDPQRRLPRLVGSGRSGLWWRNRAGLRGSQLLLRVSGPLGRDCQRTRSRDRGVSSRTIIHAKSPFANDAPRQD
jgi:hypothetical protein